MRQMHAAMLTVVSPLAMAMVKPSTTLPTNKPVPNGSLSAMLRLSGETSPAPPCNGGPGQRNVKNAPSHAASQVPLTFAVCQLSVSVCVSVCVYVGVCVRLSVLPPGLSG